MMNPYDIHSWSTRYREDALEEARTRHLVQRARASRDEPRALRRAGQALRSALAPLRRGVRLAG
jgi:hypothetical protein